MARQHFLVAFIVGTFVATCLGATCSPYLTEEYLCHESDPTQYYACSHGNPHLMFCPAGLHFDVRSVRCVNAATASCSHVGLEGYNEEPRCDYAGLDGLYAHPWKCHAFLNCSSGQLVEPVQECPYPSLFSIVTFKCEPFYRVDCYGKYMPIEPCEYDNARVPVMQLLHPEGSQMIDEGPYDQAECSLKYPSCVGLLNGYRADPSNPNRYMNCYEGRTLEVKYCPDVGVYSPQALICVRRPDHS